MGREYEEERLFSEKLDRLLAGEEIQIDAAMDDDLQYRPGFCPADDSAPGGAFFPI